MPDPTPPAWLAGKGPGDPLYDAWLRGEQAKNEAAANKPPAGPPAGTKVGDRYIEYGAGPNGTNVVHEPNGDGTFRTSYTSVGMPRTGGTTGSTGGTTYPTSTERRAQEQAAKGFGSSLPTGAIQVADTRAVDKSGLTVWTKDLTGNWVNSGYSPTKPDLEAARRIAFGQRQGGGTTPSTTGTPPLLPTGQAVATQPGNENARMFTPGGTSTLTPEARPFAGLGGLGGLGLGGTLEPRNGPVVPGMEAFRQPGIGIPSEGRQPIGGGMGQSSIYAGLNTLFTGRQGSAQQIPITPGFRREGENGNNINFASGSTGYGTAEPQMLFAPTSVSVPGTYTYGQGNVGDSNRAYAVPFNIGPGGAGLMNLAGNNMQINSADRGTGYGFALNAMPSSNVGAATSRNLSEDPASQAAQILMLNAALNQMGGGPGAIAALTATNPNQYGGFHAGTGNGPFSGNGGTGQGAWFAGYDPNRDETGSGGGYGDYMTNIGFAGGGRVMTVPLGATSGMMSGGPKSMVTNGPKYLIDAKTGKIEALMGEDNADPGFAPNRERLTFSGPNNSMLRITPLEPFAGGGQIQSYQGPPPIPSTMPEAAIRYYLAMAGLSQRPELEGAPVSGRVYGWYPGFAEGGRITTSPPPITPDPTTPPPVVAATTATPPPATPPPSTGLPPLVVPPPIANPFDPNYNPLNTNIAQPWEQAQQQNAIRDATRARYGYRQSFAGLNGPIAVQVNQGDAPTTELAPNMYYDTSGQVNDVLGRINNAQAAIRATGPATNPQPMYEREGFISTALSSLDKINNLELQKISAEAAGNVPSASAGNIDSWNASLAQASEMIGQLLSIPKETWTPSTYQEYNNWVSQAQYYTNLIQAAQNAGTDSLDKVSILQAQIDALKSQLPAGLTEEGLKTELAAVRDKITKNQGVIDKTNEVKNLQKLAVPKLNAPILPVGAAA